MPDTSTRPPQYTGSDEELDSILEDAYVPWEAEDTYGALYMTAKSLEETGALDELVAWRDAAIARHLAEAGAVHPAVHTPNRVMQWLGEHGWQAAAPNGPERIAAPWVHHDTGYRVFVSLHPEVADYSRYTEAVVAEGGQFAGIRLEQALLEIALLPDEVAF